MTENTLPFAPAILRLLQGVLDSEERTAWSLLLNHEAAVREYLGGIGLTLQLYEQDGFAFVSQPDPRDDDPGPPLPRLVRRHPLSYELTLLLVLLREALLAFDAAGAQAGRLVLTLEELRELQLPYAPARGDAARQANRFDAHVNRAAELGYLRRLTGGEERYEVRRVLAARLPLEQLESLKQKLVTPDE